MAHNGKLIQINCPENWQSGYFFLNALKSIDSWFNLNPEHVNATGYPTVAAGVDAGGAAGAGINIPSQAERPGNYVFVWNGTHDTGVANCTIVSGNFNSGSNRCVFTPDAGRNQYTINGNGFTFVTPSTDMYICHVDDEAALLGGEIFQTKFLGLAAEGGVWRFMQAWRANDTNWSKWAYRKPVSYVSYRQAQFSPTLYQGLTSNVSDAFSIAYSGFTLTDKITVQLKFNATSSGTTPTLNVNSTGNIPIVDGTLLPLTSSNKPTTGFLATLVYSSLFNVWMLFGGANTGIGIVNGWPPEIIIALCNKINCHCWVNIPYISFDPMSDIMDSFITLAKATLNAGLKVMGEPGNEIWNNLGDAGTIYAWAAAKLTWPSTTTFDDANWMGKALSQMGQAIFNAYAGDTTKYEVICPCQAGGTGTNSLPRLNSNLYVGDGGVPAKQFATKVSVANYYTATASSSQELAWAYAYSLGDATAPVSLATTVFDYINTNDFGLQSVGTRLQRWGQFGSLFGIKLMPYEGGYSPDYPAPGSNFSATITGISKAANAVVTLAAASTVPVAGMSILFSSVSGMTEINALTGTVVSVNGLLVTVNIDSTTFTAYTSGGTATYVNSGTMVTNLRSASRFATIIRTAERNNFSTVIAAGGTFPSCYDFSGNSAFSVWDTDTYVSPTPPRWLGMQDYNSLGPITFYGSMGY